MLKKPQLYDVELVRNTKNNPQYTSLVFRTFNIPENKHKQITDAINNGEKVVIARLPLDIAKTLTNDLETLVNEQGFVVKTNLKCTGIYDEQLLGR